MKRTYIVLLPMTGQEGYPFELCRCESIQAVCAVLTAVLPNAAWGSDVLVRVVVE